MSCLPGMPCYDAYRIAFPFSCGDPCQPLCFTSDKIIYNGPNLACTGIQSQDNLEIALQKIDGRMCSDEFISHIIVAIEENPVLKAYFCQLVSSCPIPTTTTTSSTSSTTTTSSTTSSSTTTTTTTQTPITTTTTTTTLVPLSAFISTWDTRNTSSGSTSTNQIKLPLEPFGTYNFIVNWGDGSTDTITSSAQIEITHTYVTPGIYTIIIQGIIDGFRFNITGDRLKILSVLQWGNLKVGDNGDYFFGCSNLDLSSVTDVLDLTGVTDMTNMFSGCTSLTTIPYVNLWDTSSATNMAGMFLASTFNDDIGSWNVSNVINMTSMFNQTTVFNQDISSWNVSSVTDMTGMFAFASAFNQNIGTWNVSNVNVFSNFMQGKTFSNYSSTNLDSIYNNWSLLTLTPSISINFGTIKYTSAGTAGKNILLGPPNNWTIIDGGI